MNKERYNQIVDEAYESYLNYPLATIHDHRTNILYKNMSKGWCMLNGRSMASPHPTRHLTKEEFINKIKTDTEFSEKWGLKIEERELTLKERYELAGIFGEEKLPGEPRYTKEQQHSMLDELVPTKLITIKYQNKTIESYE